MPTTAALTSTDRETLVPRESRAGARPGRTTSAMLRWFRGQEQLTATPAPSREARRLAPCRSTTSSTPKPNHSST